MSSTAHDQGAALFALPDAATLGDAARVYLGAGLRPVILSGVDAAGHCTCQRGASCPKPGKHPRRRMWQATPSLSSLAADVRTFPDGNVGLMMGGPERLIAIDVDGPEGLASLAALERELDPLPATLTSETGGGGRHLVLRAPPWLPLERVKNTASQIAPHVDVRGEGGQIVVAPSRHRSGRRYRWVDTRPPATLPDAWAERLATLSGEPGGQDAGAEHDQADDAPPPRAASSTRSSVRGRPGDDERRAMYARKALERTVDAIATLAPGNRNAGLNAKAYSIGHFVGAGWLARREVERALLGAARACGLPKDEAEATIRSGLDAGAADPWDGRLPEDPPRASSSTRSSGPGPAKASPRPKASTADEQHDQGDDEPPPSAPRGRSSAGGSSWRGRLLTTDSGKVRRCLANVVVYLQSSPGWEALLAFDVFADRIVATRRPPSHEGIEGESFPRPWRDADDLLVVQWLSREHGIDASRTMVADAVIAAAQHNRTHPVREYLDGLRWDGTPRIATWLTTYFGVAPGLYSSAVGAKWLRAAVARIMQPGCKADTMLVLEGEQGALKSSALGVLGGAWFTDELEEVGSKDAAMQLRGAWVVELAELDAIGRAEVTRIKAFLTRRTDRYRPAYGRHVVEQPREVIFAGTCNRSDYLRDDTGNRRFWPVLCTSINLDALRRDRDQLWAEAVATFRAGESWWVDKKAEPELAAIMCSEQGARFQADVWQDRIAAYLHDERHAETRALEGVAVAEILSEVLAIDAARWGQTEANRVASCLRALGLERKQKRGPGGSRTWRYFPKATPETPAPAPAPEASDGGPGGQDASDRSSGQRFRVDPTTAPPSAHDHHDQADDASDDEPEPERDPVTGRVRHRL